MSFDPIADLLARLQNAALAGHSKLTVPYSDMLWSVTRVLQSEGFIVELNKKQKDNKNYIHIELAVTAAGRPALTGVKRVSKLSRRVYAKAKELRSVRGGYGRLLVSTPEGVMTGRQARHKHLGGEVLCEIW